MYIIWHDNDYDFAKWVYENSSLFNKDVTLRIIPKSKEGLVEENRFIKDSDYAILPIVKLATPDIIIQKIEEGNSKIIFVSEFMTHTPQHDHVFQRFERIYCVSKEKIPVALILPKTKNKLEKGSRDSYKEVKYHPTPLTVHTYLKTTLINKNPTLMFFWPEDNGYLKYDQKHQTAPKIEGDIKEWFNFLNESLLENSPEELLKSRVVKKQLEYLLEKYKIGNNKKFYDISHEDLIKNLASYYNLDRIKIIKTGVAIRNFKINKNKLSKAFLSREWTVVFEYNSRKFRTDPYCGFICGYTNLLCTNNENERVLNLIHVPKGILYGDVSKKIRVGACFSKINEDLSKCPLHSLKNFNNNSISDIKNHLKICTYTKSKQQRIYGTIPDLVVFDDEVFYIK